MMESSLKFGVWRIRVERNEECADKKRQKELQKRAERCNNAEVDGQ